MNPALAVALAIGLLVLASGPVQSAGPEGRRPSFVVILADDLGFSDLGSYGGEIPTPSLDALAAAGLRFTQFYVTPRCSPTRASLLTGLHPHEAGMGYLPFDWSPPGYTGALSRAVPTLPERLSASGYRSYLAGKWHLTNRFELGNKEVEGDPRATWPLGRGFQRFYGVLAGASSYYEPFTLTRDDRRLEPPDEGFSFTEAISDAAVDFVRQHTAQHGAAPFFLYVAYSAPHWPLHAREEEVARHRGRYDAGWDAVRAARYARMLELGIADASWPLSPRHPDVPAWEEAPDRAWQARRMEVYAAQVEAMDRGIGRIVAALRETGRLDDTLVLFLSDNGASAEEVEEPSALLRPFLPAAWHWRPSRGGPLRFGNDPAIAPGPPDTWQSVGLGWANVSSTPFRLYKEEVYEGGIASPLIAHWPAGLAGPAGGLTPALAHVVDVAPTLLELAGLGGEASSGLALRGRSLVPVLAGDATAEIEASVPKRAPLFWEHQGHRALREGRWKAVSRWRLAEPARWELYDLELDRSELHDLAELQPERLRRMAFRWEEIAISAHVQPWPWPVRPLRYAAAGAAALAVLLLLGLAAWQRRRKANS